VFNAAQDTATFIDELPADQYAVVFVVADAPNTLANGNIASYHLTATAHRAGGTGLGGLETQTLPGKQTVTGRDVIFVDGAGTDPNDGPRNGAHSDQSDYKAVSAVISVTKSVAAITDPYGSNAAIPGATVTYQIQVTNAAGAGAPAVLSTITDTLPAQLAPDTTAKAASWTVTGSTTRATTTGTLTLDNGDANNDGLGFTGQQVTFTLTKILPADAANNYAAGELKPGETLTLKFNVIIQ
ncbi:MAG: isopeptide-forming domain-containing fimbrial protein, partial [Zetaproteobacteria bacterium]